MYFFRILCINLINRYTLPKKKKEEKECEINIEEVKKDEIQEDRDDDPEDFEEFADEKDRILKIPIQNECASLSLLPEKNKIEVKLEKK